MKELIRDTNRGGGVTNAKDSIDYLKELFKNAN